MCSLPWFPHLCSLHLPQRMSGNSLMLISSANTCGENTQGCSQELSTTMAVSYNYKPTLLVGPGSSPIRTAQSSSGPAPLRAVSYR